MVLTTMSKTGLSYQHKGQNKTAEMKIHVTADLYLPSPHQRTDLVTPPSALLISKASTCPSNLIKITQQIQKVLEQ